MKAKMISMSACFAFWWLFLAIVYGCNGLARPPDPPLHQAAFSGNMAVVRKLLDEGASPNLENYHGDTALHSALRGEHYDVAELLISRGADVNWPDRHGSRGAETFSRSQGYEQMQWLLKNGLDRSFRFKNGENELFRAVQVDDERMVGILLDGGFDPEAKNAAGRTPLDVARELGHRDVARRLRESRNVSSSR